ncbi:MAG: hypothetical protein HQK63_00105 [Desulfamplus sp.]|nr:hypothetical protein [Desulfamplus sp.]
MINQVYQTSFDLTLLPGEYLLEVDGYGQTALFSVIAYDNCTNETERPFMYDENNIDAFGNVKPA